MKFIFYLSARNISHQTKSSANESIVIATMQQHDEVNDPKESGTFTFLAPRRSFECAAVLRCHHNGGATLLTIEPASYHTATKQKRSLTMPSSGKPENDTGDTPGEAALLVSEFPPPPYYYRQAAQLTPPEIPTEALERASQRAAAAAAKAKAESERLRLQLEDDDKTHAILGGVTDQDEEEEGDVVAVFGEIVEVCVFEAMYPPQSTYAPFVHCCSLMSTGSSLGECGRRL